MLGQRVFPCVGCPVRRFCCCISSDPVVKSLSRFAAVTFLLILPLACFSLQYSFYYAEFSSSYGKENLNTINDRRIAEARRYLEMLDQTKLETMLRKFSDDEHVHNRDVIISIITVSRNRNARRLDGYEPYYLTQVVHRLLALLHEAQAHGGFPYHVRLFMCNVDPDPEHYAEAQELARYLPMISRFHKLSLGIGHPLEKEKQDYVFCLNSSLALNPGYAFLVEDDALPHNDVFSVLRRVLDTHLEGTQARGEFIRHPERPPARDDVAYVKFYHPERLLGFIQPEWERVPELLGWGATVGSLLTLIYIRVFLRHNSGSYNYYYIWTFFIVYVMLFVMAVGRVHVNELRRWFAPYLYTYNPAPSCCTPAMLFPRTGGARVAEYLTNIKCGKNYGKDTAIEDFLRVNGDLKAYHVQPNTFTHIGMYSSLRSQIVDPYLV